MKKYQLCYQDPGKKWFDNGIIIPVKMRFCNECNVKKVCNKCNNQINENKEFEANLNELKRRPPNDFGHMLPKYIIKFQFFWFDLLKRIFIWINSSLINEWYNERKSVNHC